MDFFLANKLSVAFMETVTQLEIEFWRFPSFEGKDIKDTREDGDRRSWELSTKRFRSGDLTVFLRFQLQSFPKGKR